VSGPGIIEAEGDGRCQLCGKIAETRPYGPNGEEVCFECGMKDEAAAERGFLKFVCGLSDEQAREEQRKAMTRAPDTSGMEPGDGRSASPSGHSSETEPCSTVSAQGVSVPNAKWFCTRCREYVRDSEEMGLYVAGKCACESSPSPWVVVHPQTVWALTWCGDGPKAYEQTRHFTSWRLSDAWVRFSERVLELDRDPATNGAYVHLKRLPDTCFPEGEQIAAWTKTSHESPTIEGFRSAQEAYWPPQEHPLVRMVRLDEELGLYDDDDAPGTEAGDAK
jgi:hypothetical protein